jgi:hypothetical protein
MKMRAALSGLGTATILSRLLLVLGLLLGDLIPDPRAAQASAAPAGAADLLADASPAILPSDSARLTAALPQDDTPDAVIATAASLPQHHATAQPAQSTAYRTPLLRPAHVLPYPQGPPAV